MNSWIELNVQLEDKKPHTVIFEVSDNGSGIEESNIDIIFDPFFSTKSSKRGTGMGLYLCNAMAGKIGAGIEVDSDVCMGSTFRLITGKKEMTDI